MTTDDESLYSSARITDPKLLEGQTQKQLSALVDVINRGYPHLKISKSGNKTDLIRRIIATNNLLEACKPIDVAPAKVKAGGAVQVNEQSSTERAEGIDARITPILKRKRCASEKSVYIDLIKRFNSSQVENYDPRDLVENF